MKKITALLLIAVSVFAASCTAETTGGAPETTLKDTEETTVPVTTEEQTTEEPVVYHIANPYDDEESRTEGEYQTLNEAKNALKKLFQYGYVIFDSNGEVAYIHDTDIYGARILWHAKIVADYIRDEGYRYGDASKNPALDRGKTEKIVSCDRFVGWVLYDAGYVKKQPSTKGLTMYTTNNLEAFLIKHGFEKIENIEDVRAGDVVFVGYSNHLAVPSDWKNSPDHVFICAGATGKTSYYRYDAGSNSRISSTQPSREPLEYSNKAFRYAYRATK